eukprot:355040-Chlamydomonas_euryale.AAC.16
MATGKENEASMEGGHIFSVRTLFSGLEKSLASQPGCVPCVNQPSTLRQPCHHSLATPTQCESAIDSAPAMSPFSCYPHTVKRAQSLPRPARTSYANPRPTLPTLFTPTWDERRARWLDDDVRVQRRAEHRDVVHQDAGNLHTCTHKH